jgi:hypothetical protein
MILRRVIKHVRNQEWTAIGIDFLIVVVGVFVGIQVSNWNEAKIERMHERSYLIRLHEDIVASIEGQMRDNDFHRQQLADQAVMLTALDACSVPSEDDEAFQRGANTLGYINAPRLSRRTIEELAASGRTDIIRSQVIRNQIAEIVEMVEWRGRVFDSISRRVEHYRFVVDEQVRFNLSSRSTNDFIEDVVEVTYDIQELCKKPETSSAISAISLATQDRINAYSEILSRYRAFLPLLEEELRFRWNVDNLGVDAQ